MNRKELEEKLEAIRQKTESGQKLTHKEEQIWAYANSPCRCDLGVGAIKLPGNVVQRTKKYWRNESSSDKMTG